MPNWLSPVGALAGALRALGSDIPPPPYLSGVSGHAFQLALSEGRAGFPRPSPPTGATYQRAVWHYAELGLRATYIEVKPGDQMGRDDALSAIRGSIDGGRPAVAFGLHLPEFGLIRGYDDQRGHLIVSTLTTEQHGAALPLALWPPPGTDTPAPVVLLERFGRLARGHAERAALRFALAEARAQPGEGELAVGLDAYGRWREALLATEARIDPRGNAYTIQTTLAARREAAQFLDIVAERRTEPGPLRAAADAYREETLVLSRLSSLFPYPHGGDVANPRTRQQGARYLEDAERHERMAVGALAEAAAAQT